MLELSGIPRQDDENIDLVNKSEVVAEICNFDMINLQINIAHRVSEKRAVPVIVLFTKKAERTNFYREKNKIFKIWASHIIKANDDNHSDQEVSLAGHERENGFIYMNGSFNFYEQNVTERSNEGKKEVKLWIPRYTVNCHVRVKKSKSSEYMLINSKQDLGNITQNSVG